jgi:hypothetical protein
MRDSRFMGQDARHKIQDAGLKIQDERWANVVKALQLYYLYPLYFLWN